MFSIIVKTVRDLLSPTVLGFILKTGLGSFLFWIAVLWMFWKEFESFVASYIAMIPYVGRWEWFQGSGIFLAALAVAYILVIVSVSVLTSLFSEGILKKLAAKHYPGISPAGSASLYRSAYYTLKAGTVFITLFVLTFPLIFVPVIGQVWILWLWSILLKEPMVYDVGSLFGRDETLSAERKRGAGFIAMIAATFNYIPFLNIFAPLFAQILFMHYLLKNG